MTSESGTIEREVKFEADVGFVLPDLGAIVGVIEEQPERQMRTAYFDTPELRLWRRGITLRHRSGEASGAGTWTMKLPERSDGPTLDRTELSWTGSRESCPAEAMGLLRGITRRSGLRQIVELVTTRRRLILHDAAGTSRAELDDDIVKVHGGTRDGVSFRQIELELGPGGGALVGPVSELLTSAGAGPGGAQKLAKAMDLPPDPSETPGSRVDKRSTMGDVVRASLIAGLDRLLDNEYRLRLEPSDPPVEGIHQARVATRRLRSDLKSFGSVLDPTWVAQARAELKWLGEVLGRIRDADVLSLLFDRDDDGSSFDAGGRRELRAALDGQRRDRCRELAGVLISDRYLNLIEQLDTATHVLPLEKGLPGPGSARSGLADKPAKAVLPALVDRRRRSLRQEVRKAGSDPSDRELHAMRIRAKELRYAAELAAPVLGDPARHTAAAAEMIQNLLGEHHDAVSAELWLRTAAMAGTLASSYSAGRLAAEESSLQDALRHRWQALFDELDQKKLRRSLGTAGS